jgi:hypothetical protein
VLLFSLDLEYPYKIFRGFLLVSGKIADNLYLNSFFDSGGKFKR